MLPAKVATALRLRVFQGKMPQVQSLRRSHFAFQQPAHFAGGNGMLTGTAV